MDAEEKGANSSVRVDKEGYVAEGLNLNDVFITHGEELVLPSFDKNHKSLSGCTTKRLFELSPKLVEQGDLKGADSQSLSWKKLKVQLK